MHIPNGEEAKATEDAGAQEKERPINYPAKGDELRTNSGSRRGGRKADSNGQ
jgi:hypothetical protein